MFKRISEACFHYFSVPFDWSKAELRWEMLFASRSETIEEQKCWNELVKVAFTILLCHLIDLKWNYLLRGQRPSKSENIEKQKCWNELVKLAFTILLCHLIDQKRNFVGKCYLLRGQRPSKSEREANPSVNKDYLLASRSETIEE